MYIVIININVVVKIMVRNIFLMAASIIYILALVSSLLTANTYSNNRKPIYLKNAVKLEAGEVGYLHPSISYSRCHIISSGNDYSFENGRLSGDGEYGLRGGNEIKNIMSYLGSGGSIYITCY